MIGANSLLALSALVLGVSSEQINVLLTGAADDVTNLKGAMCKSLSEALDIIATHSGDEPREYQSQSENYLLMAKSSNGPEALCGIVGPAGSLQLSWDSEQGMKMYSDGKEMKLEPFNMDLPGVLPENWVEVLLPGTSKPLLKLITHVDPNSQARNLEQRSGKMGGFNFGSGGGIVLKDGTRINFGSGGGARMVECDDEMNHGKGDDEIMEELLATTMKWSELRGEFKLAGNCEVLHTLMKDRCLEICVDDAVLAHMNLGERLKTGGCVSKGFQVHDGELDVRGMPPLIPAMRLDIYTKDMASKARNLAGAVAQLHHGAASGEDWDSMASKLWNVVAAVGDLEPVDDDSGKSNCVPCHLILPSRKQCLESCVSMPVADFKLIPEGKCSEQGFVHLVAVIPQADIYLTDRIFLRRVEIYRRPNHEKSDSLEEAAVSLVQGDSEYSDPGMLSVEALEKWAKKADKYMKHLGEEKTVEHFMNDLKKYISESAAVLPKELLSLPITAADKAEECETVSFNLPNSEACVSLCLPAVLADLSMLQQGDCLGTAAGRVPIEFKIANRPKTVVANIYSGLGERSKLPSRNLRSEIDAKRIDWNLLLQSMKILSKNAEQLRLSGDVQGFINELETFLSILRPSLEPLLKGADSPTVLQMATEFNGNPLQCVELDFPLKTLAMAGPLSVSRAMSFGKCGGNTKSFGAISISGSPELKLKYRVANGAKSQRTGKHLPQIVVEWLEKCREESEDLSRGDALKRCLEEAFAKWIQKNGVDSEGNTLSQSQIIIPCSNKDSTDWVVSCFASVVQSAQNLNSAAPWSQFISPKSQSGGFVWQQYVDGGNNKGSQGSIPMGFDWKDIPSGMMSNPSVSAKKLEHQFVDNQDLYCSHVVCPKNLPYCDYGVCTATPPAEVAQVS